MKKQKGLALTVILVIITNVRFYDESGVNSVFLNKLDWKTTVGSMGG